MLALPLAGYDRYVITGGSMGDTIERGSVVWAKAVPVADLQVGDVITYTPPRGAGPEGLVTHRIVAIRRDRDGRREFRTKGDANAQVDPWTFNLDAAAAGAGCLSRALSRLRAGEGVRPDAPHDRRGARRAADRHRHIQQPVARRGRRAAGGRRLTNVRASSRAF